jgi:LmbE family N-acetylglucosaminyl deacetylase
VRDACKLARLSKLFPLMRAHAVRRVYYYMLADDVVPSWTVDVTPQAEMLEAAIRAHASQMAIARHGAPILDVLRVRRQAMGQRIGAAMGESFLCEDAIGGPALSLLEI